MVDEKWLIHPGENRVIDLEDIGELKVGLVGGQIDVIAHDDPHVRLEVHSVAVKDLRIERTGSRLEVDHPQLGLGNFFEVFRNLTASGPRAEISIAVPRALALSLGVVSAGALVAGLAADARVSTASGDVLIDGLAADLWVNSVSGDVQVRQLEGACNANTVSGDVSVTGRIARALVDSVSGSVYIDADGPIGKVAVNSVSGGLTLRLDEGYPANYVARSVSGRVTLDGAPASSSGPTNYVGSSGELSGHFVDVAVHTVSGDIAVIRRGPDGAPSGRPVADAEVEWPSPSVPDGAEASAPEVAGAAEAAGGRGGAAAPDADDAAAGGTASGAGAAPTDSSDGAEQGGEERR